MSHYRSASFCLSLRNEFSPPNTANLPADIDRLVFFFEWHSDRSVLAQAVSSKIVV
jgi:hypothetical protein